MGPEAASLVTAEIERYLAGPGRRLAFAPAIEAEFAAEAAAKRRETFYRDSLGSVIFSNLAGLALVLTGAITPLEAVWSFVAAHGLANAPTLAVLVLLQRRPTWMEQLDRLGAFVFLASMAGVIAVSRCFRGEAALYQAFAASAIPVNLNLLRGLSFRRAATLSLACGPALIWNAFTHPDFSASASWFLTCFYLILIGMSLSANRRMEASQRLNYLNALRERLRNREIAAANRRLEALSRTDALTGLPNRRDFDSRFAEAVRRAKDERRRLTVLILDIDHFKLYNDSLGHPQGDKCLRAVAGALAEAVGSEPNFVARIGGEEFSAVLPDQNARAATATAARIRSAVRALGLPHAALGEHRVVSLSLGLAGFDPASPETPEALLARADAALYRAKRAGRDRAEVHPGLTGT